MDGIGGTKGTKAETKYAPNTNRYLDMDTQTKTLKFRYGCYTSLAQNARIDWTRRTRDLMDTLGSTEKDNLPSSTLLGLANGLYRAIHVDFSTCMRKDNQRVITILTLHGATDLTETVTELGVRSRVVDDTIARTKIIFTDLELLFKSRGDTDAAFKINRMIQLLIDI